MRMACSDCVEHEELTYHALPDLTETFSLEPSGKFIPLYAVTAASALIGSK